MSRSARRPARRPSLAAAALAGAAAVTAATLVPAAASPAAIPAAGAASPAAVPAAASAGRFALGDSVMLGAASALRSRGFRVDAKVSRQFSTADDTLAAMARSGGLPRNVVVALGTNGTIGVSECLRVVSAVGPSRRLFLVTNKVPRSWQASNNRNLRTCDASVAASRVVVVDWYRAASGSPSWFAGDGYHLTASGRQAYARLLDAAVDAAGL